MRVLNRQVGHDLLSFFVTSNDSSAHDQEVNREAQDLLKHSRFASTCVTHHNDPNSLNYVSAQARSELENIISNARDRARTRELAGSQEDVGSEEDVDVAKDPCVLEALVNFSQQDRQITDAMRSASQEEKLLQLLRDCVLHLTEKAGAAACRPAREAYQTSLAASSSLAALDLETPATLQASLQEALRLTQTAKESVSICELHSRAMIDLSLESRPAVPPQLAEEATRLYFPAN